MGHEIKNKKNAKYKKEKNCKIEGKQKIYINRLISEKMRKMHDIWYSFCAGLVLSILDYSQGLRFKDSVRFIKCNSQSKMEIKLRLINRMLNLNRNA